ncbi:MAG: hypothetical protein PHE25_04280 [Candidatus Gracilibacteria bacterium]|nr:hypothetical protein [Candidatus Gracilibacteria bacterium]
MFERGSEWRKWDLQVQTIIDDGYISIDSYIDDLKTNNPEKLKKIIEKIGSEELLKKYDSKTYYFTDAVDDKKTRAKNYAKVFLNYIDIFNENIGAVGITDHNYYDEYLLDALVNESKNTIIKIIPGVEVNVGGIHTLVFFGSIPYGKNTYSEGIKTFLSKININNPKENGVLTVSHITNKNLINIVNEIGGVIIYAHCNSSNGLFQERTKTDRTFLADIFNEQKVNILQSKNKEGADITTAYIRSNNKFISNFNFTLCSDSRCLKDVLSNDNAGNFTWIKADPTFEGLKQIIYEPTERVIIQSNKPEEKTGYQAIDRIEINSDLINNKEILFNQNLNSIIGGRSTGKSILLASIALKLKLENKPIFNGESKEKYKDFIDSISKNIRIFWKDGKEEYEREVEYFQQSYMYELAKNTKDLDNVIENILREKGKSKDLDEYRNFTSINSKNISVQVSDLFQIINDLQKVRQLLLELGDKDGVNLEIEKLEKEIKNNTKTEINDSEKQKYDDFKIELEKLQKKIDLNKNDLENIEKLKSHNFIKDNIDYELLVVLDENRKTLINEEYGKLKTAFKENFELKLIEISKSIEKRNLEIDIEIKKIFEDEIYKKVLLAFNESSQIQEIEDKLKIQKSKLFKIEENINKISSLDKQQNSIIENIKKLYKNFEFKTSEVVDVLSDNVDGLEIKAKINYKENIYRDILSNALDNRTVDNKKYIDGNSTEIFSLFSDIIKGNLSYRSSYNSETFSKRIMSQCLYDISFDLIYESDNFLEMSDGKKAFVVLKLLLDFSNKECPILIDQPEDDLDNRSIYNELVEYLKKKKKKRQIIVATHNPNVVVTADSEEVIVANQHGNGTPNIDKKKFQYISGSLENTQFLDEAKLNISILNSQGINEHVCDIVEGGEKAFEQRKKKYNII